MPARGGDQGFLGGRLEHDADDRPRPAPTARLQLSHRLGLGVDADVARRLFVRRGRRLGRGIPAERIILAGFSQGGAIAINTVLRAKQKLAGLMPLSSWLALPDALQGDAIETSIPVFMAHGQFDPMIPMQYGRSSADALVEAGFDLEWHDYPMAHAVCAQEIDDIRTWLLQVLSA